VKSAARQAFCGRPARWRREKLWGVAARGQGASKRRFRARRRVLLTRGAVGGGGWRIRGGALTRVEETGAAAQRCRVARGRRASNGGEWDQGSAGRLGGTPINGAGLNHGVETMAAALQSSGGSVGRRKVGGTYLKFLKP